MSAAAARSPFETFTRVAALNAQPASDSLNWVRGRDRTSAPPVVTSSVESGSS
jgi:hypothetical protein